MRDNKVSGDGDFHNGGHDLFVVETVTLGVGVEFSNASGAEVRAPFYLCDRNIAEGRVDGAKGDQAVGESPGGLKDVVVRLYGEVVDLPAHAEGHGDVYAVPVHFLDEFLSGTEPGLGVGIEVGESGVAFEV